MLGGIVMKIEKLTNSILIIITSMMFCISSAFGYDDAVTHPSLTRKAISISNLDANLKQKLTTIFINGIVTKINGISIIDLLAQGSIDEDHPICRPSNHFQNPLLTWDRAGISTISWPLCPFWDLTSYSTRYSAITWATGFNNYNGPIIYRKNQEMGWNNARDYYYSALTSMQAGIREDFFTKTFQAVGQVMHMLQDMAVPAHVRNDFWNSHVWTRNSYETYVKQPSQTSMISNLTRAKISSVTPRITRLTDFWDTTDYASSIPPQITNPSLQSSAGLAEYTNANFVSEGTLFSKSTAFMYPRKESTTTAVVEIPDPFNPGQTVRRHYYYKTQDWEANFYLAGVNYDYYYDPDISSFEPAAVFPPLDEKVHNDYAMQLLPRAVGYSAGLLDYFFRGTLGIRRIPGGIKVKNTNAEDMASYTDSSGSALGTIGVYYDDTRNLRKPLGISTLTAPLTPGGELTIQFSEPSDNIQKGRYIVVFRGKLGNEEGAVIGKITTIPIYYVKRVNGHDKIFMRENAAGDETIVYENDANESLGKMSVSPDNSTLAFTGNSLIKLLDLTNIPATTVTTVTTGAWPDWSPDGKKIVFHRIIGQNAAGGDAIDIFIINITTLSESRLTTYTGLTRSAEPAWSPDGNTIAYTKYSPTDCSTWQVVYLMDTAGNPIGPVGCPINSTTTAGAQPAWSPDGQWIAFVRIKNYCIMTLDNPTCQEPLTRRLYKVNRTNQGTIKLTDTPDADIYDELHPAWSPDGATIAISSEKSGTRDVWSVDALGRGYQLDLTNEVGSSATYPAYGK